MTSYDVFTLILNTNLQHYLSSQSRELHNIFFSMNISAVNSKVGLSYSDLWIFFSRVSRTLQRKNNWKFRFSLARSSFAHFRATHPIDTPCCAGEFPVSQSQFSIINNYFLFLDMGTSFRFSPLDFSSHFCRLSHSWNLSQCCFYSNFLNQEIIRICMKFAFLSTNFQFLLLIPSSIQ